MMNLNDIMEQIREKPLIERLGICTDIIGKLCDGGELKMSIPACAEDDDLFVTTTLMDAIIELKKHDN